MIFKKAYSVSMTYEVSSEEKSKAEQALILFDHSIKLLSDASDHLNIIKTPFKDNAKSNTEEILDTRTALRRFRDKSVENFNKFKVESFKCVNLMKYFSSDTQTLKLMKSFIAAIESLEENVNSFYELFDNLKDKDFQTNVVKDCDIIQNKCDDIKEIIDQRIRNHIQNNILSKNWVDNVSSELQANIDKKTPLLIQLQNERQEQLNDINNQ